MLLIGLNFSANRLNFQNWLRKLIMSLSIWKVSFSLLLSLNGRFYQFKLMIGSFVLRFISFHVLKHQAFRWFMNDEVLMNILSLFLVVLLICLGSEFCLKNDLEVFMIEGSEALSCWNWFVIPSLL